MTLHHLTESTLPQQIVDYVTTNTQKHHILLLLLVHDCVLHTKYIIVFYIVKSIVQYT
jgi:hypothetical protein